MTQIPLQPPPPPPPLPPAGTPQPLPSVTVINPPTALTSLPAGTQIEATVATTDGQASVRMESDLGSLQIQTTVPLEKGSILRLVLHSLAPQVQLQIATINGKLPHIALRGLDVSGFSTPATQQTGHKTGPQILQPPTTVSAPGAQGVNALIGTRITATLLRPAAMITIPTGPGQVAPGAGSPVVIPGIASASPTGAAPKGPTAAPTIMTPPGTTQPGAATSAPVTAATVLPASAPLVQGSRIPMQVSAVRLPGPDMPAPPAIPTPPALGQTFIATVTGSATNGHAIVQTPMGPMTLSLALTLPHGTQLTLEITGAPLDAERATPIAARAQTLFRARDWPALKEAFQALQTADPAMAQHLATSVLPRADTQLAANIIFFLSALRGGDVSGWLGADAMRVLQRTQPNLASRVRDEFRDIGTMAAKPMTGDWRMALIPFFNGSDIDQARLFVRPYGGDDPTDQGAPKKGTRFIIDVDLSRFSRLQLDGLVREANKRLDLIVRSDQPLPNEMRNDIRTIFREANELIAIEGGLTFQAAPANFVEIMPDDEPDDGSDLFA